MQLNYCTQCGKTLVWRLVGDEGEQRYCADCRRFYFDNPAPCVLTVIVNERNQVLLLKQRHISEMKYTLCSGYVKKGDTLEETVIREVLEETGQQVLSCQYVQSYYFAPKNLMMAGFIARVNASAFAESAEVEALHWCGWEAAAALVEREKNLSGVHLDACRRLISEGTC